MKLMSEEVKDNSPTIMGWKLRGVICGTDGEPRRMLFQKNGFIDREFKCQ